MEEYSMNKLFVLSVLFVLCLFTVSTNVQATIIGGPGPEGFGADDGAEIFSVGQGIYNIQFVDILKDAGFPTVFGFYFAEPSNPYPGLIPIFGSDDSGFGQLSIVDFVNQRVTDEDLASGVTEFDFSSLSGSGDIGFFYAADLSSIGVGSFLLYSEASRNGGVDAVGTFPSLYAPDNYVLGFELFNPDIQDFQTLSAEMVIGVTPASAPVPEPGTFLLIGSGLLGLAALRKNKK